MTKLRIAPDGVVRALWTDEVDWASVGKASVERASHIEFCKRRQLWYVRASRRCNALRAFLQFVLRRPFGPILHWSGGRGDALAWEREYFSPGGPGWQSSPAHRRQIRAGGLAPQKEENRLMELLRFLLSILSGGRGGRQRVSGHQRRQAYGPRWTQRRRRHIAGYRRRRPR